MEDLADDGQQRRAGIASAIACEGSVRSRADHRFHGTPVKYRIVTRNGYAALHRSSKFDLVGQAGKSLRLAHYAASVPKSSARSYEFTS